MKNKLALLFLVFFFWGCGVNPSQKILENQTGTKVDVKNNGETVTVKGKDGESVTFGAKEIPGNFPKDIPIYPGSKPTGSYVATGTDNGLVVGLETTDDFNKVAAYYLSELKKNGWQVDSTMAADITQAYSIKKGEMTGVISIQKQEEKKVVGIAIVLGKLMPTEGTSQ